MKKNGKRLVALILAALMIIPAVPVLAADAGEVVAVQSSGAQAKTVAKKKVKTISKKQAIDYAIKACDENNVKKKGKWQNIWGISAKPTTTENDDGESVAVWKVTFYDTDAKQIYYVSKKKLGSEAQDNIVATEEPNNEPVLYKNADSDDGAKVRKAVFNAMKKHRNTKNFIKKNKVTLKALNEDEGDYGFTWDELDQENTLTPFNPLYNVSFKWDVTKNDETTTYLLQCTINGRSLKVTGIQKPTVVQNEEEEGGEGGGEEQQEDEVVDAADEEF